MSDAFWTWARWPQVVCDFACDAMAPRSLHRPPTAFVICFILLAASSISADTPQVQDVCVGAMFAAAHTTLRCSPTLCALHPCDRAARPATTCRTFLRSTGLPAWAPRQKAPRPQTCAKAETSVRPQEPDAWWKEHSESWLQAHTEEAFWKEINDPAYDVVLVGAISTLQPCCSSASDCSPTRQCLMDFRFCRLVCSLVPWLQALVARTQPLGFQWQVRRQSQVPEGAHSLKCSLRALRARPCGLCGHRAVLFSAQHFTLAPACM